MKSCETKTHLRHGAAPIAGRDGAGHRWVSGALEEAARMAGGPGAEHWRWQQGFMGIEHNRTIGWWFGTFVIFLYILEMSSSQLTNIFQRG